MYPGRLAAKLPARRIASRAGLPLSVDAYTQSLATDPASGRGSCIERTEVSGLELFHERHDGGLC
jgi:hypothetical protein